MEPDFQNLVKLLLYSNLIMVLDEYYFICTDNEHTMFESGLHL